MEKLPKATLSDALSTTIAQNPSAIERGPRAKLGVPIAVAFCPATPLNGNVGNGSGGGAGHGDGGRDWAKAGTLNSKVAKAAVVSVAPLNADPLLKLIFNLPSSNRKKPMCFGGISVARLSDARKHGGYSAEAVAAARYLKGLARLIRE
jgi:hypothetical protein